MKSKLLFALIFIVGAIVVGFISGDPHGSKSPSSNAVNPPVGIPVNHDLVTIYTDNMDGNNDTTSLKARGYKVWYRGSGPQGLTATWFSPSNPPPFNAFNGPTTGYVAANFNIVTGTNNIDSWLVFPRLTSAGGILTGDSLYFYSRSPTGSTWPDSIRVMYSANDSVPEGSWTELGRFKTNTTGSWERKGFRAPSASVNGRFAIRYCVVNGGPNGSNSDFIGIDAITIERTSSPTTNTYYFTQWCAGSAFPVMPAMLAYTESAWLGDTLYVHGVDAGTTVTATIYRYSKSGNSWSTGVPLPSPRAQGFLVRSGAKLYYVGGGTGNQTGEQTNMWEYTPSTGTWTTKAPLPAPKNGHVAVNWGDSVIFVVGGPWASPNSNVYAYRTGSDTWISSTPFIGPQRRSHAGGMTGNKIMIAGGFPFTNTAVIGTAGPDASTIAWTSAPNFPSVPKSRVGGTAVGDRFYLVGGNNSVGATSSDSTFIYSFTTNTWSPLNSVKPDAAHNIPGGVTWRNDADTIRIYVVGGSNLTLNGTNNFHVIGCGPVVVNIKSFTNNTPEKFILDQNYPNPFNPATKISFAMPRTEKVSLVIFDITGKEVARLLDNQVMQAGTHIVDFNASYLASGVYIYRMTAGDFVDTKKMMLVK